MKIINLSCHGMTLTIDTDGEGGGSIVSDLDREVCPHCDTSNCFYSCDGSKAEYTHDAYNPSASESEDEIIARAEYNTALNTIESFTLALVNAFEQKGTPVEGHIKLVVEEAIETALDAVYDKVA